MKCRTHYPILMFNLFLFYFFFFNDTATTEIYTLSLHDALPISPGRQNDTCPSTKLSRGGVRSLGVTSGAGASAAGAPPVNEPTASMSTTTCLMRIPGFSFTRLPARLDGRVVRGPRAHPEPEPGQHGSR